MSCAGDTDLDVTVCAASQATPPASSRSTWRTITSRNRASGDLSNPLIASTLRPVTFDAVVVGAGVSGLYQLHRLRELGMSVHAYEAGGDVGGTWYWNRYPGARFDSESYSYGYFFSPELLDEWDWSRALRGQPETERYLHLVADRFGLRDRHQFDTRVLRATWRRADRGPGTSTVEPGESVTARFVILAIGVLSIPVCPSSRASSASEGELFHTGHVAARSRRPPGMPVAVIGTGATAVQLIPEVAKRSDTSRVPANTELELAAQQRPDRLPTSRRDQ